LPDRKKPCRAGKNLAGQEKPLPDRKNPCLKGKNFVWQE
jgi:hypothetical protein